MVIRTPGLHVITTVMSNIREWLDKGLGSWG
jgi:hypothetical protein